jgi:uncharacterized cysteine cluster protein YcgN (CxxCxxCC family)
VGDALVAGQAQAAEQVACRGDHAGRCCLRQAEDSDQSELIRG